MSASVTETLPSWAIWVPVVSAGIGGLLVIIGNVINNLINKKSEANKQIREAILKTAMNSWKENMEITKVKGGIITPLESYIMHMALLSDIILDPKEITEKALIERLKKSQIIVDAYIKFDKESKAKRKKAAESNQNRLAE